MTRDNQQWFRQLPFTSEGLYGVVALDNHIYAAGARGTGSLDVVLAKYDESGNLLWDSSWGGSGTDRAYGIATDGNRLFVVGETDSTGAGGRDALLLEGDPATGAILAQTTYGGAQDDAGRGVVVSGADLFVAGESRSFAAGGNTVGQNDVMLLQYSIGAVPPPTTTAVTAPRTAAVRPP